MGKIEVAVAIAVVFAVLATRCAPCEVWRWLRVLWVCRIPAVGVLAGFLLLVYTEQGRDLFSDLGLAWWQWFGFFALTFIWAWIVHAVARSAVQYDDWVPEAHVVGALTPQRRNELRAEFYHPAVWIPRLLGGLVFVCVAWGLLRAYANVRDAGEALPLGRETKFLNIYLLIGTIATAIVYAVIVYKRRNLLHKARGLHDPDPDEDPDYPLLTGAVPLAAVLREWSEKFPPVRRLFALIWALWCALLWVLGWFCLLGRLLVRLIGPPLRIIRQRLQTLAARIRRLLRLPPAAPPTPVPVAQPPAAVIPAPRRVFPVAGVDYWLFLVSVGFWIVIVAALWSPHSVAWFFPRALFVPVFISGFVFATGWIAAWSHRLRTPLLLIVVFIGALLVFWFNHFHDVRWVSRQGVLPDTPQQISFDEAVARWTKRNGCTPAALGARVPDECRPIIVAGAGGASRAGFMTASLVGALIDLETQDPEKYKNLRNRIFALSTVSGSSVGAVVIRAALTDAITKGNPKEPPCEKATDGAWFGNVPTAGRSSKMSWRDCFQQLLAGDFLSPVMVGIAFRDNFPLGNPVSRRAWWEDRAALLEQGFERRYAQVTGQGGLDCKEGTRNGLCRRFGYHPDPEKVNAWVPLLFINGTSVKTGRRIIVGDVNAGAKIGEGDSVDNVLFKLAYDANEIRDAHLDNKSQVMESNSDLFLSTTSTMSARFPVVSPQGLLRDKSRGTRDSIVDGGYFENQGLVTAGDLVRALQGKGLEPIVVRVLNDPEKPESDLRRPVVPKASGSEPFEGSLSIVQAIYQTRSGHEDAAIQALRSELNRRPELGERFFTVTVYPLEPGTTPLCRASIPQKPEKQIDMKVVSMSWWMSQVVQAYLDAQLCVPANVQQLECQLRAKRPGQCP